MWTQELIDVTPIRHPDKKFKVDSLSLWLALRGPDIGIEVDIFNSELGLYSQPIHNSIFTPQEQSLEYAYGINIEYFSGGFYLFITLSNKTTEIYSIFVSWEQWSGAFL